jgi:hypothetical protein
MRLFFVFVLCVLKQLFFAQLVCKGALLDANSGQPVEFANIGIVGKGVGTVSNEKGEYNFKVPDSLAQENVRISVIGYNPRIISIKDLQQQAQIQLTQNVTNLKEVAVSVAKTKVRIEGNNTRTKAVSGGFKDNSLGAEMGVRIAIKRKQTHLRKVMININMNTLDTLPVFRFNLYKEADGLPGENLLTQNIIIVPKEKTGYLEFDLRPYSLFVDENIFITLEWIKDLGDAKGLYFSTRLPGHATYFRQTSQAKWQKITGIGIGLHAEVAY